MAIIDDETRFICDVNDSVEMKKVVAELDSFKEKETQQMQFLKKQVEDLEEENKKHWAKVFETAQAIGKIPKNYKYSDWAIQLAGPDHSQMFIAPKGRNRSGLPVFIQQLLD